MAGRPTVIILVLCLGLNGCSAPTMDTVLEDYAGRIARVLEVDVARPQEVPRFPVRRALHLNTPELRMGMLEFLSLYDCELNSLIGQRNSVLGRVMKPSQQLLYEQRFLKLGHDCLAHMPDDDRMRTVLSDTLATKVRYRPHYEWNALMATEEMQGLMSYRGGLIPLDAQVDWRRIEQALVTLTGWIGRAEWPSTEFEAVNQQLSQGPSVGRLVLEGHRLEMHLSAINDAMQQRIERRPLCLSGRPTRRSVIAVNVLTRVFAAQVQPRLVVHLRARERILPAVVALAAPYRAQWPEAWRQWSQAMLDEDFVSGARLRELLREHAELWKQLLAPCGWRPGQQTGNAAQ